MFAAPLGDLVVEVDPPAGALGGYYLALQPARQRNVLNLVVLDDVPDIAG
jgi:hypothetical protein